jgi:TatD DNase family protein
VLIDSHCHLGDDAFAADVAGVVARAVAAGVARMVVVGESREAAGRALMLAEQDSRLDATAGVHPHAASSWNAETEAWLRQALTHPRVVAAGEMGLDYHYDHSPRPAQQAAFEAQLEIARQTGKPAVIHARSADDDVAAILTGNPGAEAILHSWSSGPALLRAALALNHYVSFSGMVTFKGWKDDEAIRSVPADRILVETDAPYLAPVPHRGKRNEPAFVVEVAKRLAAVRGVSYEAMCEVTTANAKRVFGLPSA